MGISKWAADKIKTRLERGKRVEDKAEPPSPEVEEAPPASIHGMTQGTSEEVKKTINLSVAESTKTLFTEEKSRPSSDFLSQLNNHVINKYKNYGPADISFENQEFAEKRKYSFHSFGTDSSKSFKQEVATAEGGEIKTIFDIGYHRGDIPKDRRESYLEYKISNKRGESMAFEFRFYPHMEVSGIKICGGRELHRASIWGIEKDGLHIESSQQSEWRLKWGEFFRFLGNNEAFDTLTEKKTGKYSLYLMRQYLSYEECKNFNPNKVLDEMEEFWNLAYANHSRFTKKKFPREMAPLQLGNFPPDYVMPYADLIKVIEDAGERLTQTIQSIEEHGKKKPGHPYR